MYIHTPDHVFTAVNCNYSDVTFLWYFMQISINIVNFINLQYQLHQSVKVMSIYICKQVTNTFLMYTTINIFHVRQFEVNKVSKTVINIYATI